MATSDSSEDKPTSLTRPVRLGASRLESFSDGVFAIAITLLILNFHIPSGLSGDQVWQSIADQKDVFFSAAISFAVIGVYWSVHRRTFSRITGDSGALTAVNFLNLATIVFLPFPTLVMSEYTSSFAAVGMYAATIALAGFTAAATIVVAWRGGLMESSMTQESVDESVSETIATPIIFALSIPIAAVNPRAATWFWIVAFFASRPIGALTRRFLQRRHR